MMLPENEFVNNRDDNSQSAGNKPNAYKVNDDDDVEASSVTDAAPIREGQPMGGHNFGNNNNTPAGDDKNNPSQNAGYSNEYFRRTEPSEEHPENTNFKVDDQDGAPDYNSAHAQESSPDEDNGIENHHESDPNPQAPYREGTADNDGKDTDGSSRADTDPHLL